MSPGGTSRETLMLVIRWVVCQKIRMLEKRKLISYAILAGLVGVFALSGWLASQGRFLEAITLVGVVTTLGWFLARILNRNAEPED